MTLLRGVRSRIRGDRAGQVGIGTMIVFIATVLVAAIAAGVLIATSGKLQERSSRTGNEATEQVSTNIDVISIVGRRNDTGEAGLNWLDVYVTVAAGAQAVDLGGMRIQLRNGTELVTLRHQDAATPAADRFNATEVRDDDDSFTSALPVITPGDVVKVVVALFNNGIEYEPREAVTVSFIPEVGSRIDTGFTTPASYASDTIIELD